MPSTRFFRRAVLAAASALVALLSLPGTGGAQEVGLSFTRSASDLPGLAAPSGFLFSFRAEATERLSVRAGIYRKRDEGVRQGRVCIQYEPPVGCQMEEVRSETGLRGVHLATYLRQPLHRTFDVELGAGVALNRVSAEDRTESGRRSDLFVQNSGQPGVLLGATGRFRPAPGVPVTLEVGVSQQYVRLNACSDDAWRYDPYCGVTGFQEVRVGVGWALR